MASSFSPDSDGNTDQEVAKMHLANDLVDKARRHAHLPPPRYSDVYPSGPLGKIVGVRLPDKPPSTLWDISIADGRISSVDAHDPESSSRQRPLGVLDGANRLLAPSLCHAHIHLDKCFLLQDPKFSDLEIEKGDFQEAMEMTGKAKARFEENDLLRRGRQFIEESIHYGVTAMRAFVEVDGGVQFKCLDAGLKLKEEFQERCEIQLCAFAQLPLFSGEDGGEEVRRLMQKAALGENVTVIGSTPYVEKDLVKSKMNVAWITMLALSNGKNLDLHLDYDLYKPPLIWATLDIIKSRNWNERTDRRITLGHCTRLTRFREGDWQKLKRDMGKLPVAFIGLPTSDLFIMKSEDKVRGTLPVVEMIEKYGLEASIAVNNVGNAFTPYGNCDPLSIASLGVGVYQAGTKKDAEILYQAVSSRAKAAIGCEPTSLLLAQGEPADFVLFDRKDTGWRCKKSIAEAVYDASGSRQTIRRGKVTAY